MDTLVAENYVYEQTINRGPNDADTYLVKQKNLVSYIDQQRGVGTYNTSKVTIDAQTGNTTDFNDWYDAYITLPYQYKLTCTSSTATTSLTTYDPNYLLTPKNCSLIESMRVEQGGRVIIQDCSNLSHLVNFVKHQTTTASSLNTEYGDIYYPDSEFSESLSATIAGVRNVSNSPVVNSATASNIGVNTTFNQGALMRQRQMIGNNRLTTFVTAAQSLNEQAPVQVATVKTAIPVTGTTDSTATLSDVHYLAVIKLRDLSDYFAKHPLSKGGYKFTFTVNQATTIMTTAATTGTIGIAPFALPLTLTATTLIGSSSVQPCMANIGGSNCVNSLSTNTQSATTTYTYTLTSRIDSDPTDSANARQSGVFLWVPSLTLSDKDEQKLLSQPIVSRTPYMLNSSVYTTLTSNAPINLQLFQAISNPRALIVIPQFATSVQTQPSQCSPFNPSPGCTDPLSLTKLQIRLGTKSILPAPINYGWNAFIQNTAQLFTINGGISDICSGTINLSKWMNNYRYYAFDLSLLPADQRDIPQIITLEGFNNSNVSIDLYVYVLFEQDATWNLADATAQIGTS